MWSDELIEEIERLHTEFGRARVQVPDPVERWWYDLDRIERDAETNTFRLISDH